MIHAEIGKINFVVANFVQQPAKSSINWDNQSSAVGIVSAASAVSFYIFCVFIVISSAAEVPRTTFFSFDPRNVDHPSNLACMN